MTTPLRVLIVEDSPDDVELILLHLAEEGFQPEWRRAEGEPDYLAALETPPDLILADWSLPQFSGLRALELMRERGLDIPFVIVSGSIGEEAAINATRRGAYDYVLKDRPARLGQAVHRALEEKRLRDEKRRTEQALVYERDLLHTLMDNLPDAIYFKDADSRFTRINKAQAGRFGLSDPAQAVGKTDFDFFTEEHARPAYEDEQAIIRSGQPLVDKEEKETWPDGRTGWVSTTKMPLRDQEGRIVGTFGVSRDITEHVCSEMERWQAEEALRASEEKYRTIVESSLQGITIFQDDRFVFANPAIADMLGYTVTELTALSSQEVGALIHSEDRALVMGHIQDQLAGKAAPPRYEFRIVRKDGKVRWVDISSSLIEYGGQPAVQTVVLDITERVRSEMERQRAEEALRQSESKFRSFVEQSEDGIVLADGQGVVIEWNRGAEGIFGWPRADVLGRFLWDVQFRAVLEERRAPPVYERLKATMEESLRTGQSPWFNQLREMLIQRPDGARRTIQTIAFPIRMDHGFILGSINRDVTEYKQAHVALQRYVERLRTLRAIDGSALAARSAEEIARVALCHLRQLVPCWMSAVMTLDQAAETFTMLAVDADGEPQLAAGMRIRTEDIGDHQFLHQGKIHTVEDTASISPATPVVQLLRAGGIRSYVTLPLLAHGELIGILGLGAKQPAAFASEHIEIAREVADQIALGLYQARLREEIERHIAMLEQRVADRTAELSLANAELARAARLKDEFLAAMSHELRTPLNAVLGLSEALQEEVYGPLTDRQIQSLHTIEESGRHLLTLINDILDVSKIEAGKVELTIGPVSVESVCQASLGLIKQEAHTKQLTISTSLDEQVATVQADVRRLKQVLVNLLSNAVKFTPEGGSIGLEVVGDAEREVAHFIVWDTGIGVPPEQMERLFQPFVQLDSSLSRQHTGTGLGLVLVHRLVDMHGGAVSVESEPGKGSRFTVSLPWRQVDTETWGRGDAEAIAVSSPPPLPTSLSRSVTILLAEDNEANLQVIADYLSSMGYQVFIARDGTEAVEQAVAQQPDLILMDIQMPEMDGLEATRRIRAHTELAHTPIIALTALAMPGDRERCLAAGANGYLSKPVGLKGLMHAIEAHLSSEGPLGSWRP